MPQNTVVTTTGVTSPDLRKCPNLKFSFHPTAAPFTVSSPEYIKTHAQNEFECIGTGALVFNTNVTSTGKRTSQPDSVPRILLVKRASTDSNPNRWETPGGACDDDDPSVLYAVARELWEETGLKAVHIGPFVGDPTLFNTRSGKLVAKFCFMVDFEKDTRGTSKVRLDPNEHQSFLWATEAEVKASKVNDVELEFTAPAMLATVLQAFREHSSTKD